MNAAEETGDEGAPGFFSRNRVPRLVVGVVISVVLVAAYVFGIQSYRAGLSQALPDQSPPANGVSVVIVPEQVSPNEQELPAQVLVFPSPKNPGQAFAFEGRFALALQAARVRDFRFHDLRHSCASILAQSGATLLEIGDLLGHRQLQVTKRYSHLATGHKAAMVNRVLGEIR